MQHLTNTSSSRLAAVLASQCTSSCMDRREFPRGSVGCRGTLHCVIHTDLLGIHVVSTSHSSSNSKKLGAYLAKPCAYIEGGWHWSARAFFRLRALHSHRCRTSFERTEPCRDYRVLPSTRLVNMTLQRTTSSRRV